MVRSPALLYNDYIIYYNNYIVEQSNSLVACRHVAYKSQLRLEHQAMKGRK